MMGLGNDPKHLKRLIGIVLPFLRGASKLRTAMQTVAKHCEERGLSFDDLVRQSGLEEDRVRAIVEGRWTPSPEERNRIAQALDVAVNEVQWGHTTPVQHLWGHGPT
jgi:cyanate lyase